MAACRCGSAVRRRRGVTVTFRCEDPEADEPFLRRLILDTISGELGADQWPALLRDQIVESQYAARRHGPLGSFPEGRSRIILLDSDPAGWLYTGTLDDSVWIAEIMVRPELRGRGVGTAALREVLGQASAEGKPVRLSVNVLNAGAIRLYERLGFRRTGGSEVQHTMEARP